jgi:DNA-binding MarR family transcriptional regulator
MKPKPALAAPPRRAPARNGLDVLQQLRIIVRLASAHSTRAERSTGIPGAELWALHEVAAAEGLRAGELAERLRVHQTTISNLLTRLEARGLVKRARSAADRRIVHVSATAAGKRVLQRATLPTRGLLPHVLDSLSPDDLRKVHTGLAVLLDSIGGFDPTLAKRPLPFTE